MKRLDWVLKESRDCNRWHDAGENAEGDGSQ